MSKKQTAMQELFEYLHWDTKTLFAERWLELEKQNLIEFAETYSDYSYNASQNNRYVAPQSAEQYYNNTFNQ